MSVNYNSNNPNQNPQLLQQRLSVREQEINALKVQNRHLLSKIEDVEKQAKPNQINTQYVADEVQRHLEPVISQLQGTITSSFEILQSTMRGIYQQSQRAQQAVEDMAAHSRDLEMRMNEQRKADQNFYQDKMFSMIGAFCDRVERQIEIRMKALATVEIMNSKQNEVLNDVETIKGSIQQMQKNSDANRGEISRIERNASEANEKLIDVQMQTRNSEELIRDTLQQIQNHRAEFKIIRSELKQTIEAMTKLMERVEDSSVIVAQGQVPEILIESSSATSSSNGDDLVDESAQAMAAPVDESRIINDLIEQKHRELEVLERNIEEQSANQSKEDASMILALLRAQKSELQRVAEEAKTYLKEHATQGTVSNKEYRPEKTL
jgi:chromosome segregation ATPase